MVKTAKWETKKAKKTNQKNFLGDTDYDIPRFGYKSSFIILITTLLTLFIVPFVCELLKIDYRMPTVIICGAAAGFSTAYTQFFIERDLKINRSFWIVGTLLSLFSAMLIFMLVYMGKLM